MNILFQIELWIESKVVLKHHQIFKPQQNKQLMIVFTDVTISCVCGPISNWVGLHGFVLHRLRGVFFTRTSTSLDLILIRIWVMKYYWIYKKEHQIPRGTFRISYYRRQYFLCCSYIQKISCRKYLGSEIGIQFSNCYLSNSKVSTFSHSFFPQEVNLIGI